ncbi:DUF1653 domain-containing protein [Clostridium tagluense]|uniref:DUF1653 domain-containing protein n=1 Tax=Clostridium tagluense TaxID=360422 RepID=A0A401UQ47_9CLOT|nr:DUF1653 domain-containing protein [Clostridium tagluense]GCD11683.1 hypothetical protein Ctaglu_33060 [Clostridium tagluense]
MIINKEEKNLLLAGLYEIRIKTKVLLFNYYLPILNKSKLKNKKSKIEKLMKRIEEDNESCVISTIDSLHKSNKQPLRLGIYRHFKGAKYQVLSKSEHTETGETMVVYKALYGEYKIYVRPYNMFISMVDKVKYPDVEQENRFEWIFD